MGHTKECLMQADEKRSAVLKCIRDSPNGIYNGKIAEQTGLSHNVVTYYLVTLRMQGKIAYTGGRFDRLYFPVGVCHAD
jgi:DNA-binding IclR family transcriptional regulator